jgi:hypothetical protein
MSYIAAVPLDSGHCAAFIFTERSRRTFPTASTATGWPAP